MAHIRQDYHFITFIILDNSDIHIDTALKKISSPLNPFGASDGCVGVLTYTISVFRIMQEGV